jgi:hypothetical protein
MLDGTVHIRRGGHRLAAVPFRKEGQVRQQDVTDNKYLATILERVRRDQIVRDQTKLEGRGTLREKRRLLASIEAKSAPPSPARTESRSDVASSRTPLAGNTLPAAARTAGR